MSESSRWQLSGNAAEFYERYSKFMLEPWVPALIEAVDLQPGERVIDVACGTGFVARQAGRRVGASGKVVGIDINVSMLAIAKASTVPGAALTVDWREADVCAMPFPDENFDVALCQQGLQFFPDRLQALQEIRRILVPGGRLGLSVWGSIDENPYFSIVEAAIRRHVSVDAASGLHKPHALADPQEVRSAIKEAGFVHVNVRRAAAYLRTPPAYEFLPGHLSALPMAGEITALSESARSALIENLCTALSPYENNDGLRVPGVVNVATARASG